ncbi:iron ABC transporter substrate-binding protein [Rhodococcus rhodnii]|uniref:Fe/B12 periplasmic-binding domain-containing protein n=2 Tax=Rhodococcus rhodnii TaxID=38312 RepID=R7WJJ0_9NOCA|nr:ABC transporter substrate-binding protein [Rhodococcus rhodnii]EOM75471.1 hypothetical protein Rrhod_3269 [Rhodococcus rhodnii LMG 5362]TXG90509.1 iron ABC transporter substrate-binding protein [Rhodococcus rhodnii]
MTLLRTTRGVAVGAIAVALLAACSNASTETEATGTETVTVTDNFGEQTVAVPPRSVVATDNSTFETLDSWGVELSAAAVSLMPDTISYESNDAIVDLGNHREPNLEAIVAADPDLVINGGRFAQYHGDFERLVPDAAIVDVSPRDDQPLVSELERGTTVLGEIFGKQAEAAELNAAFEASIERVKAAYDPEMSVMGLITSGGEIGYVTPSTGRTIGPMFDIFGLTPALEVTDGSNNHQGDDISVEAIAASNPDLIIAMDRDAGTATGRADGFVPAADVIAGSEALQGVGAVREGNVIYLPADTYTNESIQTYTEFFDSLADLLESKKS